MARKTPDAIALLIGDHRKVAGLFKKFEKAKGPRKGKLAREICLELSVHTMIEETLFYPALKGKVKDDLLDESHVEHDSAKVIIADILANRPGSGFYDAKVKVLSEIIKHHVKEEEQEIFPEVQDMKEELDSLGQEMHGRKAELMEELGLEADAPPPAAREKGGKAGEQRKAR